jgi:hypothetical protein
MPDETPGQLRAERHRAKYRKERLHSIHATRRVAGGFLNSQAALRHA